MPNYIESSLSKAPLAKEDPLFEAPLRPQSLKEFLGQENICERLLVMVLAARQRSEALGHCLFCGPPGLGKTTLAMILAKEMGANLITTSGPVIDKPADLAGVLTNLQSGDVLFIDELHRMNRTVEEYLYSAMEDFVLDLTIDSGPNARSVRVNLNKFTLVGATTRVGLLTAPMRTRFAHVSRLDHYDAETLELIVARAAKLLRVDIEEIGRMEIAKRSRGTPRIAGNVLRWVRDFAQIRAAQPISAKTVDKAMRMLAIDERGLDEMDRKILTVLIDHYEGGPVGLSTLAVAISEEPSTLEEVYEPYLITQGFLKRTPRGREATALAYRHLGKGESTC